MTCGQMGGSERVKTLTVVTPISRYVTLEGSVLQQETCVARRSARSEYGIGGLLLGYTFC